VGLPRGTGDRIRLLPSAARAAGLPVLVVETEILLGVVEAVLVQVDVPGWADSRRSCSSISAPKAFSISARISSADW
jgi:hypothetical protein